MVSVPARGGPVVEATLKLTGAEPFPLGFEVMDTQSTSEAAVQLQSALEGRTSTLPVPPARGNDGAWLDSSSLHSPAAWLTWARGPFTITPPLRAAGSAFAA